MRTVLGLLATFLIVMPALADKPYPRADLLMEPAELAKPEIAAQFVILDTRAQAEYEKGHIPGARPVDAGSWSKAFGDGKDTAGWSKRLGMLGIGTNARVVVYGDNPTNAARVWWILRYWGIEDARLLNGGWAAWKAAGHPIAEIPSPIAVVQVTLQPRPERLATKQSVLDSLKQGTFQVIDARSEAEFCGTTKMAKRGGAIPGAKHLEWSDLIDKESQRFKTADQLQKLFAETGINLNKPSVSHCQSGGRSSVMVFALELMGAKDARNYYASWAEWGNAEDTPVEPGKAKGK